MESFLRRVCNVIQEGYESWLIENRITPVQPPPFPCFCADIFCEADSPFHHFELETLLGHDPEYRILDFNHLDARPRTGPLDIMLALRVPKANRINWIIDPYRSDQIDRRVRECLEAGFNEAMNLEEYRKCNEQALDMFRCVWFNHIRSRPGTYLMPDEATVRAHWEEVGHHSRRIIFSSAHGQIREAVTDYAIEYVRQRIPNILISCYGRLGRFDLHVKAYLLTSVTHSGFYWNDQDELFRPESEVARDRVIWDDTPDDLKCIDDEDLEEFPDF